MIPALANEINWTRGEVKKSKHDVKYPFKNDSYIDILAAAESSRGQRRNGGVIEEAILVEQKALTEIIVPVTNINRRLPDGSQDPKEIVNKSQIWITSAGYKNTYPFQRLIELLIQSIIEPDEVMVFGGTYKIPVYEGLLDKDFVNKLKMEDTYKEESFEREFLSHWTGDAENAFFSSEKFERQRTILQFENEEDVKAKDSFYIIGVDVGRNKSKL